MGGEGGDPENMVSASFREFDMITAGAMVGVKLGSHMHEDMGSLVYYITSIMPTTCFSVVY